MKFLIRTIPLDSHVGRGAWASRKSGTGGVQVQAAMPTGATRNGFFELMSQHGGGGGERRDGTGGGGGAGGGGGGGDGGLGAHGCGCRRLRKAAV